MFRAVRRSSSGALTVFAASGLHTHVVTDRSQVWVPTQTWLPTRCNLVTEFIITPFVEGSTCFERYAAHHQELQLYLQPLVYIRMWCTHVNQRLQIQLELLMMSGVPLETCWAFNERWNNKFCYKVASCWLFLLNSINIALPTEYFATGTTLPSHSDVSKEVTRCTATR